PRGLLALSSSMSGAQLTYEVFRRRAGWSEADARRRAGQAAAQIGRMERELDDWLRVTTTTGRAVLDIGCGSGGVVAAVTRRGCAAIGIDVSLEWLVVAHRVIAENGGVPRLAAGMGGALPLAGRAGGGVRFPRLVGPVGD